MKILFVSTWNTHCGIATYTKDLVESLLKYDGIEISVASEVVNENECDDHSASKTIQETRCWKRRGNNTLDNFVKFVEELKPDVVHIQHEYGLFQDQLALGNAINRISEMSQVFITMHTIPRNFVGPYVIPSPANKRITHIAHSLNGMAKLSDAIAGSVIYIQHGTHIRKRIDKDKAREVLSLPKDCIIAVSCGFIVPNKRLVENIHTVCILNALRKFPPEKFLYVIAGEASKDMQAYLSDVYMTMATYREDCCVAVRPRYLTDSEVDLYLSAADFAIQNFTQSEYSISGQSHQAIGIGIPLVARSVYMLDDLPKDTVLKFETETEFSEAILLLAKNRSIRELLSYKMRILAEQTSWSATAMKHLNAYRGVVDKKKETT